MSADDLLMLKSISTSFLFIYFIVAALFLKLEQSVDGVKFETGGGVGGGGFTADGVYIYTMLEEIGIKFETQHLVAKLIDDAIEMLSDGML